MHDMSSSDSPWAGAIVTGIGPRDANVMIVGETPNIADAQHGKPFMGRIGTEQRNYLARYGFNMGAAYMTYLCKQFTPGVTDPTPTDIARWTPDLVAEIARVKPRIVLAVGRSSLRWFLGPDADLGMYHGMPHRSDRAPGAVVVPVHHPAFGLFDNDARIMINHDYCRAAGMINGKLPLSPAVDEFAGREDYRDVTGAELAHTITALGSDLGVFGIDTEGYPDDTWSVQVSFAPGSGLTLRCSQRDFAVGIRALQRLVDRGVVVAIHNGMYDIEMCRVMGLDLFDACLWDSMYAAYLTRIEPQGLKPLAFRWCGMKMGSYTDTVGDAGTEKQIAYLSQILERSWPKPEPRIEYSNDGTSRLYTPQPVERRAEAILIDHYNGKREQKDGETVSIIASRWHKVDKQLRGMVEAELGPMPRPGLGDIPLGDAIYYASRDPDATLRLYYALSVELKRQKLDSLMSDGMSVLSIFEQMQSNGMPASKSYFERYSAELWDRMCVIQARISNRYFGGKPFNPASPDQVTALMQRQGVTGEKRSKKTRKVSTGKKSIEHLRHTNAAMDDVITWRELQKNKDSFCEPIIERIPDGVDVAPVRCTIKTTRVATRRISASNPNMTAMPTRNEEGVRIRSGFRAPDGMLFGSWDLSQVEMRYMAHLSRDPLLVQFFMENRDPHAETAARIFGIKLADVKEMEHRYPAKRAAFGIITSITGSGLYDQLRMFGCTGWDAAKCDDLIVEWLKVYKGVANFMEECKAEARANGVIRDYWGMPRYLPGIWSSDRNAVADAERAASSHKIQGGAQGMIQNSMAWLKGYVRALSQSGLDTRWLLQIHDEVVLLFPDGLWDTLDPIIVEGLTLHHRLKNPLVPIKAKGSYAQVWGGLKG
jgi:uracil-DNA glycosylase family 4